MTEKANQPRFQAGVATVDITPPAGLDLAGGAFGKAKKVLHPLAAKAICFADGDRRAILISCDLLGFDLEFATAIRHSIADATGVSFDAIMLACTHTHGGPATMVLRTWGTPDDAYCRLLHDRLVELASQACSQLEPVQLSCGAATAEGLTRNRARSEQGVLDDQVLCVQVSREDDSCLALIINVACHAVSLHDRGVVTPDFPHYVEEALHKQLDGHPPLFTLAGASGDLLPANFHFDATEENARETGQRIASAVNQALASLTPVTDHTLDYAACEVELPLDKLPPDSELQDTIDSARRQLDAMAEPLPTSWEATKHRAAIDWAEECLASRRCRKDQASLTMPLQGIRLGQLVILGVPGELFARFGISLREQEGQPVLLATCTNGMLGYIPTPETFDQPSYEATHSVRYIGLQSFQRHVGQQVFDGLVDTLEQLRGGVRNPAARELWVNARRRIIGGGQQHKRPVWYLHRGGPAFANRAKGPRFWDVDGHSYLDYLLGYGPILLGHSDDAVNEAVRQQMEKGTIYSVEHEDTVAFAEELCELIPCAEVVAYFIGGSSATLGAIRCARAHTRRERIIRCGYHGWYDWCVPTDPGVPASERQLIHAAPYNDLDALRHTLEANASQVAGVIVEAVQGDGPAEGYFDGVRALCDEHGALFILDEVKTGFRFDLGGAQTLYGITPDLAVFGKAMCNGYPGSAVVGRRSLLQPRTDTYLAATFHADPLSITAARTVLREMRKRNGIAHLHRMGRRLIDGINQVLEHHRLPLHFAGHPAMPSPTKIDRPDCPLPEAFQPVALRYFCGAMQRRGSYITGHPLFVSVAHTEADIDHSIATADDAAREVIRRAGRTRIVPQPADTSPAQASSSA